MGGLVCSFFVVFFFNFLYQMKIKNGYLNAPESLKNIIEFNKLNSVISSLVTKQTRKL